MEGENDWKAVGKGRAVCAGVLLVEDWRAELHSPTLDWIEMHANADDAKVQEVMDRWKKSKIVLPRWAAIYNFRHPYTCLRLNHAEGGGCNNKRCNYKHRCILCGKLGHGAFQQCRETGMDRCLLKQSIISDIRLLEGQGIKHAIPAIDFFVRTNAEDLCDDLWDLYF